MNINDLLFTHVQYQIIYIVLEETNFDDGFHKLKDPKHRELFEINNLDPDDIYVGIKPTFTIRRTDVPRKYSKLEFDLRKYDVGRNSCDHKLIELYWETNSSCGGSGDPHYYHMCCKCGMPFKHNNRPKYNARIDSSIVKLYMALSFLTGLLMGVFLL